MIKYKNFFFIIYKICKLNYLNKKVFNLYNIIKNIEKIFKFFRNDFDLSIF